MPIKHFDMFTGFAGFSIGVKRIFPDVETIGFSEIDPYAIRLLKYRFPNIKNYGDATRIIPTEIPDFDLLTFGYPCQDNSISGKRLGQKDGKRSSLLSYAIEILRVKKPKYFVAENVTGLLSVNEGSDFYKTIRDFYEVGYDVTWQCLNTRQLLPQNRDRIFIVGSLRDGSRQKIFFVSEDEVISFKENKTGERRTQTKDSETGVTLRTKQGRADDTYIAKTLQTKNTRREINIVGHTGSGGQKGDIHAPSGIMSNLNASDYKQPKQIVVESKKVKEISPKGKRYSHERIYDIEGSAVTLKSGGGGLGANTGLYAVPSKVKKAMTQSGGDSRVGKERSYHESKVAGALTKPSGTAATFLFEDHDVRRLTPVECERLQGLEEVQTNLIINIWEENFVELQKNFASVGNKNLKKQRSVGIAEKIGLGENVLFVKKNLNLNDQQINKPVQELVHISCVGGNLEIRNQGKLLYPVNTVGKIKKQIEIENFAHIVVLINSMLEATVASGKEELLLKEQSLILQENGKNVLSLFGKEIMQLVKDAKEDMIILEKPLNHTILNPLNTENIEQIIQTLFYYVGSVIIGYIPKEILKKNISLIFKVTEHWTEYGMFKTKQGDMEKKKISDTQRYALVGNGVTVDVIELLFWKLKQVYKLK